MPAKTNGWRSTERYRSKITPDNVDNACRKSAMKTDTCKIDRVIAAADFRKNRQFSSRKMQTAGENGAVVAPIGIKN
jgi:hypothetical protein